MGCVCKSHRVGDRAKVRPGSVSRAQINLPLPPGGGGQNGDTPCKGRVDKTDSLNVGAERESERCARGSANPGAPFSGPEHPSDELESRS